MAEFKKHTKNNFWHSPIMLVVLLGIVLVFTYNIVGLIKKENETASKKELILSEINNLQKRESDLIKNIEELKTEDGTERAIRDKYQVVKDGEKMVMIVDEEKPKLTEDEVKSEHSFWSWFKGLFK